MTVKRLPGFRYSWAPVRIACPSIRNVASRSGTPSFATGLQVSRIVAGRLPVHHGLNLLRCPNGRRDLWRQL